MNKTHNIAVFASGSGTNLQAIIDACEDGSIPAHLRVVITDNRDAKACERARAHNIDLSVHIKQDYDSKEKFEESIIDTLKKYDIDLICLAGYMRIVGKTLLRSYPNRILNIHPSLLPAFPGRDAQRQALEHGVKFSGCTVHIVDEKVDHGPIILQSAVPVHDDDTVETLKKRILAEEHKIYPKAISLFLEKCLHIDGRRVRIKKI
ncbi:MAG: phosphoribosylglycinamide formyltransferase [Pseudomonadota bacterium]